MRALVTGCCGYIGSVLCDELLDRGWDVTGIDNLSTGVLKRVHRRIVLHTDDVYCLRYIRQPFDVVFNLASLVNISDCEEKKALAMKSNAESVIFVEEFMKVNKVKYLIHASTGGVYSEGVNRPLSEDDPVICNTFYAQTKIFGEEILKKSDGIDYTIFRFFNVTGKSKNGYGENVETTDHLLPKIFNVLEEKVDKLTIYGNNFNTPDKTPIRDYIHVEDVVEGMIAGAMKLMKKEISSREIFNLGTGNGFSVFQIIKMIEKVTGKKINWEIGKPRGVDPDILVCNANKAWNILDWSPKKDFWRGLV